MGNVTAKTSGEIASFMTPAKTNITSLKVHFSPKQLGEGDPSPENVREIVGWDGVEVNGCGKNLFGGEAFKSAVPSIILKEDEYGKYIRLNNVTNVNPIFTMPFKENTQYTFIGKIRRNTTANTSELRIKYTDNTWSQLFTSTTNKDEIVILKSTSLKNKTIKGLYYLQRTINFDIYYNDFGIFEGDIPIESFKPYQGNTISYQWKLPNEYQEVEYIENTGTQYLLTDFIFRKDLENPKIEWKHMQIAKPTNDNMLFGYTASGGAVYFEYYETVDRGFSGIGGIRYAGIPYPSSLRLNNVAVCSINKEKLILNGTEFSSNGVYTNLTTVNPMSIFAWTNSNGTSGSYINKGARIYYLRFYNGDKLLGNFIPCYRKSDNEIGMYDTVSQTFYTNQGTGTFLKGEDVDKTFYSGYVDLISGELVETNVRDLLDAVNKEALSTQYNTSQTVFFRCDTDYTFETKKGTVTGISDFCCESLKPVGSNWGNGDSQDSKVNTITQRYNSTKAVCMRMYNSVFDINADDTVEVKKQKINTWLANNPIVISYKLAEPITHQLTPTQLQSFVGQNNFWSNADYVEIEYELKETEDIQKCRKKIMLNQPHTESVISDVANFTTNMKAPLKECKVYFNPIQEGSGDPSPDNVRNIIGWDGVSVGLPSEYQEVEYVSSTDKVGQYIDTGENVKETIRVKIKWKFNSVTNWQAVFGGKGTTFCVQRNVTSSNINAQSYGYSNLNIYTLSTNNTIVETELTANQCTNNGVTVELRKSSTYYDGTIWLFAKEAANSTNIDVKGGCDIYWCQLYDGENLLHNFIPCYRKSDGEIGMYDTVSKTFYTNAGTGTFLKGDDVNTIIGNVSWSDGVGTVYGGYVDLAKGELVAKWYKLTFDGINQKMNKDYTDDTYIRCYKVYFSPGGVYGSSILCNNLPLFIQIAVTKTPCFWSANNGKKYGGIVLGTKEEYPDLAEATAQQRIDFVNNWLKENPTTVVYKLAEPIYYQLTPQQLLTFKGENNIWSDTNGQTEVKFWTH